MREIIITIRPTLKDIDNPSRMEDIINKTERVIDENMWLCLETVGEKVLEFAHENAENGYHGVRYSGNAPVVWPARDEDTDALYRASPYHTEGLSGLDTGRRKLLDSLERLGDDNIFDVGHREIDIGTRFRHAAILEKGGIRSMSPNIGFTEGGAPRKWLVEAMAAGLISPERVNEIREKFMQPRYVPPRPFLLPAVSHIRDTEQHTGIVASIIEKKIQSTLSSDKIKVNSGDGIIVYE